MNVDDTKIATRRLGCLITLESSSSKYIYLPGVLRDSAMKILGRLCSPAQARRNSSHTYWPPPPARSTTRPRVLKARIAECIDWTINYEKAVPRRRQSFPPPALPRWIDRSRTTARAALRYKLGTLTTVASSLHEASQLYGIHFHGNFRRQNNIAVENFSFQQHANRTVQYYCQSLDKALCDLLRIYLYDVHAGVNLFLDLIATARRTLARNLRFKD